MGINWYLMGINGCQWKFIGSHKVLIDFIGNQLISMEICKNVSESMNFWVENDILRKNAKIMLKFGPKCTIGRRR